MSNLIDVAGKIDRAVSENSFYRPYPSITVPELELDLRYYQTFGVEYMLGKMSEYGFVLNADDVGIGKTAQAIACAQYYAEFKGARRILIICKKSIKNQWKSEIEKFSSILKGYNIIVLNSEGKKRMEQWRSVDSSKNTIIITNYHTFLTDQEAFKAFDSQFTIIDEAHAVKAREGVMHNAIAEVNAGTPTVLLTGTPIMSTPEDVFGIFSMANPNYLGSWEEFCKKYFTIVNSARGPFISEYRNVKELRQKIQNVMIRRTENEVAVELPETVLTTIDCDISETDQNPYSTVIANFKIKTLRLQKQLASKHNRTQAEESKLVQYEHILKAMIPLEQMAADDERLLYFTDVPLYKVILQHDENYRTSDEAKNWISPKSEACMSLLEEIIAAGEKAIIFSCTEEALLWLKYDIERTMNIPCLLYSGSVSEKDRNTVVETFKNDSNYPVLLGTDAMAEGLNLQVAKYVINYNQPDSAAIKTQRIGRVRRVGSKHSTVYCYDLIAVNYSPIEDELEQGCYSFIETTRDERKAEAIKADLKLNAQLVEITPEQREELLKAMSGNPVALGTSAFETSIEDTVVLWTPKEKEHVTLQESYNLTIAPSHDTRDNSDIYIVRLSERVSSEEWVVICKYMDYVGGGYSNYIKGFVFYADPEAMFERDGQTVRWLPEEEITPVENNQLPVIEFHGYNVTAEQDVDTRDNSTIYVLKIKDNLSSVQYASARNTFSKLGGYYSSFKKGFIFKTNPIA